jgi:hypothetical protein
MRVRIVSVSVVVCSLILILTLAVSAGMAGNLEPPGPPGDTSSYTLEDIYNRLNAGMAVTQSTFTEPSNGPGTATGHTLNDIMDLVNHRAPVPKTGQTSPYAAGDDGDLQKGVTWPGPRFTDNGDGTVADNLTGLVWLKDASCLVSGSWTDVLSWADRLHDGCADCGGAGNDCGLSDGSLAGDWRLPNMKELYSLIHFGVRAPAVPNTAGTGQWAEGDPFLDVESSWYWSSTTVAGFTDYIWIVDLNSGLTGSSAKTGPRNTWPVRGGQ